MTALLAPALVAAALLHGLIRRAQPYPALIQGARQGLSTVLGIAPGLMILLPAVYMLRASGLIELLSGLCAPLLELLGLPPETLPLMLLRPFSGSGALAVGTDIMQRMGPDSYAGRCAAVMLGSTETTFYVLTVYFGGGGRRLRRAIPAAVIADLSGFLMSAVTVRLFLG